MGCFLIGLLVVILSIGNIIEESPIWSCSSNNFELNPLLASRAYVPYPLYPSSILRVTIRFRFGNISNQRVVIVMTGLGMVPCLKGVLHYGIAGNADVSLDIGDVTIPKFWAHSGLWNWQVELYSDIGYLQFSKYNNQSDNLLNRVWYRKKPGVREHVFWGMRLPQCVNTTCLPRPPKVTIVDRGVSASVFVDNAAYRTFLRSKFNATAIDMESAAVALICHQQALPFVVIRALSDLAGGGSDVSNEADLFGSLAAQNSVDVLVKFVGLLPTHKSKTHS
ncbi:hypothetical protein Bca52824_096148 [Brassica carinata]|uniref:Nucleoside phosphorylase domain-containing protein n=1 Tax=Brassica carinata TaxID=52824 RepID=A0A8X7TH94_BRACI|nr:hypothetical protein Bca52824_096148 [Brassica carinata]